MKNLKEILASRRRKVKIILLKELIDKIKVDCGEDKAETEEGGKTSPQQALRLAGDPETKRSRKTCSGA